MTDVINFCDTIVTVLWLGSAAPQDKPLKSQWGFDVFICVQLIPWLARTRKSTKMYGLDVS